MRLSKFLALCGVGSRRKNKDLILQGKVTVNGKVIQDLSYQVEPERDEVRVEGKLLKVPPKVYYLFYKPRGYLTSLFDPHHRKTIRVFLEKLPYRVFPVGRLDKDSEGLLLLTNDGDLANLLLHPRYEVKRTYLVWVKLKLPEKRLQEILVKGLEMDGKIVKPLEFKLVRPLKEAYLYRVTLKEGVKREIRRMVSFLGGEVIRLVRIAFGPLRLDNLRPGEIRPLTERELKALKSFLQEKNQEKNPKTLESTSSGVST